MLGLIVEDDTINHLMLITPGFVFSMLRRCLKAVIKGLIMAMLHANLSTRLLCPVIDAVKSLFFLIIYRLLNV